MRRYRGSISDNARWDGFEFRADDIVICTPAKCGTTWMQTMVATLVFSSVELPAPVGHLSPWLDMVTRPVDEVHQRLAVQTHRRFIKTHTPFDGLPYDEQVTYIAVLRHPLDVALSIRDHRRTIDRDRIRDLVAGVDPDIITTWVDIDQPEDEAHYLRWWVDFDEDVWSQGVSGLGEFARHARTYWEARHLPNVTLFHYDDLVADLHAQMTRLADVLGVEVDPPRMSEFVEAARFDAMRSRAALTVPDSDITAWRVPETFFSTGGRRAWGTLLSDADVARFRVRLRELAGNDLAGWLDRECEP
ncbi:MAG: sulfotransferase domain-containing protein [Acidimicrobiia bacterium]